MTDFEARGLSWPVQDADDIPSNETENPHFYQVLEGRLNRRGFLKGMAASASAVALGGVAGSVLPMGNLAEAASGVSTLTFEELSHGFDPDFHVAKGYDADVLIRWGDAVLANSPAFDPLNQTAEAQATQFGYNNDFVGFIPLPLGSNNSDHGLLTVNHEYTIPKMMYKGSPKTEELSKEQADVDMMAHGLSVIEIKRVDGKWRVLTNGTANRRITPLTEAVLTGPAAGSDRMKTAISKDGVRTLGTYGNCAGGVTPWGTVLTAEENVQNYFKGKPGDTAEAENYKRFGIKGGDHARYAWADYYDRWNVDVEPNEPLHVGWIVEIDPFDPKSKPMKRTALGRFKHEGCNVTINADGHVVAYTGDDERFEYIYRFISKNKYNPDDRAANMTLLEEGTLAVAEFKEDGTILWHDLVHGQGKLTAANGFHSQADVVIDARKAADLLGATPMDRPEDIEVNPVTGTVFAMLTNNTKRKGDQVDPANPRAKNAFGHIVEMTAPNGDHSAREFKWDMFLLAGNPKEETGAMYNKGISENGWLADPDNCAFDNKGRLWIATDGAYKLGVADGVWACDVTGEGRALTKHFLRTPQEAELCGPFFNPDNSAFFCAVQHPGEKSNFDAPSTRWPDFADNMPPRPSVVVITKQGGGEIGS
ncbi:PhoX family protein [Aestuariispira ectoiniformans]|uniref:PhoX family protein n=1 Tax=Aestuariispira ectoiniformans TaxID=2775080 RepID=UPI00223BB78B|nr:PhoX family phosphatase [Aestuariispira ectoiniformans]